jgi:AraC-like DNA-binding protein
LQWSALSNYSLFVNQTATHNELSRLAARIKPYFDKRVERRTDYAPMVYSGYETRRSTDYFHDGLRRGADPAYPYIVFQYGLEGWGIYADKTVQKVPAGSAFTAVCPSEHRYYYPRESPGWTFFFLVIRHPYVVARMTAAQKNAGPVLAIPPDSVLLSSMVALSKAICESAFSDSIAEEQMLFDFMFAYERFAHQLRYARPVRDKLLDDTRRFVLKRLARSIDTAELAQMAGMSRSHFGHYFKATTGLTPAHVITQIRLQEAAHRLVYSPQKLELIARETGFADANHLCKVFRRHHHVSPGQFRKQMR